MVGRSVKQLTAAVFYNRANVEPAQEYGFDLDQTSNGLTDKRATGHCIHFL
jgi:hypothetical protein